MRRERIWALVAETAGDSLAERICTACVQAVGVSGAGMTVMDRHGHRGLVHATDSMARRLEEVQLTLGEGPCVDAFAQRSPVLVGSLTQREGRWPAFSREAGNLGVAAVFSFPLQIGAARLGVLDMYRLEPGALSADQVADALLFADLGTEVLLVADPDGPVGVSISLEGVDTHAELYQASGMLMVQLDLGPAEALARLQAYAYANDLLVTDVARRVITGELRFEGDQHEQR
ncbi:MAG TPA: GAF and ANTAR domain-containing protein [Mycobacteriales bacterium]|nr:GAF and ANTAR domain-containing protein [Mycobacteriales bacterium]